MLSALLVIACYPLQSSPETRPPSAPLEEEDASTPGEETAISSAIDTFHADSAWDAELTLLVEDPCTNPCTFQVESDLPLASVSYQADGWELGSATQESQFSLTYSFYELGQREILAQGWDAAGQLLSEVSRWVTVVEAPAETDTSEPDCLSYHSKEEEYAPVQICGAALPEGLTELSWQTPSAYTRRVDFYGVPGSPASHEGLDLVHADASVAEVPVIAIRGGVVVYSRTGCPQSDLFSSNQSARECGSGWGNHLVIWHEAEGVYSRYAHLAPTSLPVQVGDQLEAGAFLGWMGNSGRSELRHLHLELGTRAEAFDPCAPAQSLDEVLDPAALGI